MPQPKLIFYMLGQLLLTLLFYINIESKQVWTRVNFHWIRLCRWWRKLYLVGAVLFLKQTRKKSYHPWVLMRVKRELLLEGGKWFSARKQPLEEMWKWEINELQTVRLNVANEPKPGKKTQKTFGILDHHLMFSSMIRIRATLGFQWISWPPLNISCDLSIDWHPCRYHENNDLGLMFYNTRDNGKWCTTFISKLIHIHLIKY